MQRDLAGAIHRAARSAAAIDSGFALYASLMTRTPSAFVKLSIRQRRHRRALEPRRRTRRARAPSPSDGRRGERVRHHVLARHREVDTRSPSSPVDDDRNEAPPSRVQARRLRRARRRRRPPRTSRPAAATAARSRATTGSSAFSTATPVGPRASTGSAEASTIASQDPKISRCATPDVRHHHDVGTRDLAEQAHVADAARAHLGHE